jgi:predicted glutamine amidotransferase
VCRLYGFLATDATRLECSLVEAQNALMVQSDRDRSGRRHPDGWGIAQWREDALEVLRSDQPAFADHTYVEVAGSVDSRAIMAHIRTATVGPVALENTHPFSYGSWAFAHNGTVGGFEHVRTRLDLGFYAPPWGGTDSETVFRWILNRMDRFGLDPEAPAESVEPVVALIEDSVSELIDFSIAVEAPTAPTLNFVMSDGKNLIASRFGNSLHWTFRRGMNDCSICDTSHCEQADETYKAVVVASEPLSNEEWLEIPEGTVFGVNTKLETMSRSLISPGPVTVG